jgi:SAM-dependent methyltransferase
LTTQYSLGSDPAELSRLNHQGRVLAQATRMIFERSGIAPGMRVLDLGSGAGDVAFLVADLVGPAGRVIGIDLSPDACAKAAEGARERGLQNTEFLVGDIHDAAPIDRVDAIVCRLVLMHVSNPVAVLRTQTQRLRPGGIIVPIELDLTTARAVPQTPLLTQIFTWIREAFSRLGMPTELGPTLWNLEREAGLRPLGMFGVQPYFGPTDPDGPAVLTGVVRALLPLIERSGAATATEIGLDSLKDRLSCELAEGGAVFAHPSLVSAWATVD